MELEELREQIRAVDEEMAALFVRRMEASAEIAEAKAEYKNVWMPFEEALKEFGDYEKFHSWNLPDYGLYRREYMALKEYAEKYPGMTGL